jgi:arsenate reductase (glutaredoxin)
MTVKLYGIPNCDKVRSARNWFEQQGTPVDFHDFRKDGIDATLIRRWLRHSDWSDLVNRTSPTWRNLPETLRNSVRTADDAIALMIEHPTLIKRPVVECDGRVEIGFRPPK